MLVLLLLLVFTTHVSAQVRINEIHPNPESESEWVELYLEENEEDQRLNLENYSLEDSYHQIYLFSDELFNENNLLTVEVSGLNNGEDQVILKNPMTTIIDQFSYSKTEKGLSWSWCETKSLFELTIPSKNETNPEPTPTATEITPTPTITVDPEKTSTLIIENDEKEENQIEKIFQASYSNYIPSQIKIKTEANPFLKRETRMVFLQEKEDKKPIINAIMGGSLISTSAYYLLYVRIKKH